METTKSPEDRHDTLAQIKRLAHFMLDQMHHVQVLNSGGAPMLDELLLTEDISGAALHSEMYDSWVNDFQGRLFPSDGEDR